MMAQFQRAGVAIDNNGNGWAQAITIAQTIFQAGIAFVKIIDHLSNRIPFYGKGPFTLCKIAQ